MKLILSIEFFKLLKQNRTYYALTAIFILELIVFVIAYYQGAAILDILLNNIKDTFYFSGNLLNGNLLTYLLLNSLWFDIPLILMIVISGMITTEYQEKTLQSIFLQPVSKFKFILSKYVVGITFTMVVVLLLAITSFGFSFAIFGKGDLVVYMDALNFFESKDAFNRLFLAFVSGSITLVFFSVLSLTLGIIFKETIKTWIFAALLLIISNLLSQIDMPFLAMDKWFLPKLIDTWRDFFYYEIPFQSVLFKSVMLCVYILMTIAVGIGVFQKRDIG
jgi:ABC-2 type transport system permease protein